MNISPEQHKTNLARAFNEWMRRYIEEPERFAREWQSVKQFQQAEAKRVEPSYGDNCAGYLLSIMADQGNG